MYVCMYVCKGYVKDSRDFSLPHPHLNRLKTVSRTFSWSRKYFKYYKVQRLRWHGVRVGRGHMFFHENLHKNEKFRDIVFFIYKCRKSHDTVPSVAEVIYRYIYTVLHVYIFYQMYHVDTCNLM